MAETRSLYSLTRVRSKRSLYSLMRVQPKCSLYSLTLLRPKRLLLAEVPHPCPMCLDALSRALTCSIEAHASALPPYCLPGAGDQPDAAQVAAQAAARADAWRVYDALLDAVAHAMRERMVEAADALVAASRWDFDQWGGGGKLCILLLCG